MANSFWTELSGELRMALIAGAVIVLLLIALVWMAWQRSGQDAPVLATRAAISKDEQPVVSARVLRPEPYQTVVVISGQTVTGPVVEVTATTAGTFTGATVKMDDNVSAGEVVATMRPSPLPAANPLQEQLRQDMASYDATPPVVRPVTSSIPWQMVPVEDISLTTPASGRVLPLPWTPGTLLSQGQPVVRVMTLDPLGMQGLVSASDAARVQPGAPVNVYLENGVAISGTVNVRGPASADPDGRYQVAAILAPRETLPADRRQDLQPGLNGRMVIPAEVISAFKAQHSWLVPATGERVALMTVVSGSVVAVPVTLLADSADGVWLTGLPEDGAVVITGWARPLAGGQAVTVRMDDTEIRP